MAGGPGVDGEAENRGGQRAPADGFHADEEHADEDGNAQAFLDEFEPQEELFRAAGFEEVQVDELQVPGGVGEAEDLQVGYTFLPARAVAEPHDGLGKGGGEAAEPGDGQGEEAHVAAVDRDELFRAVLKGTENGEGNLLNHVAENGGAHGGQLRAVLVPGQGGGGVDFADEEGPRVDVGGIQQAGGCHAAAQRGEFAEGFSAETEAGAPGAAPPEEQRADAGAGYSLHHVGPHAPALPCQYQAEGQGSEGCGYADEGGCSELTACHVVRHVDADGAVEQHDEGRCLHESAERRGIKKCGQPGG